MRILLFGKSGQIGWELQRSLSPLGDLVALGKDSLDPSGDFTQPQAIAQAVRRVAPHIIVNAAAYTAVDAAEREPELAHTVNAMAPAVLAQEAACLGSWLIHYSTDYVFDGNGNRPWIETDRTGPLGAYGKSKLDGETAILTSGCNHLIFRTSWVYAARGNNFPKTMLRLAKERDVLAVVDDQIGAPTAAELVADVTAHAIRVAMQNTRVGGLYHLAAAGETSWHGYARFVIDCARQAGAQLKTGPDALHAVPSSAFSLPATRPKNSRMNTRKLQDTFGLNLPHWQQGVTRLLAEILERKP